MLVTKEVKKLDPANRELLSNVSPNASSSHDGNEEVITKHDADEFDEFHPNGVCGCLLMYDDYFANIRCGHLIWIDGTMESEDERKATLLVANHKGSFAKTLILW